VGSEDHQLKKGAQMGRGKIFKTGKIEREDPSLTKKNMSEVRSL